jgi:hypothetical protein
VRLAPVAARGSPASGRGSPEINGRHVALRWALSP